MAHDSTHHRAWLRGRGITPRIDRKGIESTDRPGRNRGKIDRTLAWFTGYRRLTHRYERNPRHYAAFVSLAATLTSSKNSPHETRT